MRAPSYRSRAPRLYPPDASGTSSPRRDNQKCLRALLSVPWAAKSPASKNHSSKHGRGWGSSPRPWRIPRLSPQTLSAAPSISAARRAPSSLLPDILPTPWAPGSSSPSSALPHPLLPPSVQPPPPPRGTQLLPPFLRAPAPSSLSTFRGPAPPTQSPLL